MARDKLKGRRKDLMLTQEEVAERSGICRGYYSNIETGKKGCSTDTWLRIAKCLKIQESELFSYITEGMEGA